MPTPPLTDHRATLDALVDRLLPPTDGAPGGSEAGVAGFLIDWLTEPRQERAARGLAGLLVDLDRRAEERFGKPFAELDARRRDALVRDLAEHPEPGPRAFLAWLLERCLEGFLSSPAHGGNRDGAGWRAVGYPAPPETTSLDPCRTDRSTP